MPRALALFTEAAEAGFAYAHGDLGRMHELGLGTPVDYAKAADHYAQAEGNVEATVDLGALYLRGDGVAEDGARARELFKQAADQGHARGATALAQMYDFGLSGTEPDHALAHQLYLQGANGGYAYAGQLLSNFLSSSERPGPLARSHPGPRLVPLGARGRGPRRGPQHRPPLRGPGRPSLRRGAGRGPRPRPQPSEQEPPMRAIAFALCLAASPLAAQTDEPAGDQTAEQIEEARQAYNAGYHALALTVLIPAAEAGNADAQNVYGIALRDGAGVEADAVAARDWYEKAAAQGHLKASHNLARLYQYGGEGVPQDHEKARALYEKIIGDYPQAGAALGLMYEPRRRGREGSCQGRRVLRDGRRGRGTPRALQPRQRPPNRHRRRGGSAPRARALHPLGARRPRLRRQRARADVPIPAWRPSPTQMPPIPPIAWP